MSFLAQGNTVWTELGLDLEPLILKGSSKKKHNEAMNFNLGFVYFELYMGYPEGNKIYGNELHFITMTPLAQQY